MCWTGSIAMKKNNYRFIKICVSLLIFTFLINIFNFIFTPVTYGHWAIHERKQLSGKIDTVIIGDSFPMYAVQPEILDKTLGCNSFNASSASQHLDKTYYLLLDYINTENIKTVFFGLDYYNFLKESEISSTTSSQIVYKRLTNPKVKLDYLKNYFKLDDTWDWLFPQKISPENFPDVKNNLKVKLSYEYLHYLPSYESSLLLDSGTYYYDKGYVRTDWCNDSYVEGSFDMKNMSEKNIQYFESILELCQKNNIDLKLFHTPVKTDRLQAIKNYSMFTDMVNREVQKYGYKYTDYNFYPYREKMSDDLCFVNAAHLNYTGSKMFMDWLCDDSIN